MTIFVGFLFKVTKQGFVIGSDVTKSVAAKTAVRGKRGKSHSISMDLAWHGNCVIELTPQTNWGSSDQMFVAG